MAKRTAAHRWHRQQKIPHQDFLAQLRAQRAHLDPDQRLESWDPSSNVDYDQELWAELCSRRFLEAAAHVTIVGPVGIGKTLPVAACRGSPASSSASRCSSPMSRSCRRSMARS